MLKITTMNTPKVELDGKLITFPFKRADALLYYMAVERTATRQELIALLWEDCDEATGLKNLRNTLYNLKKALGGEFLISPQKAVIMVNSQWELDLDYDHFVREGDSRFYGGTFLQGFAVKHAFAFEEWMCRTGERLHDRWLGSLVREMEEKKAAGEYRDLVELAKAYLVEDPLQEHVTVLLMEAYRELAEYSKATEVYEALKEKLADELGTDPLDETKEIYYRILNQWEEGSGQTHPTLPVGREEIYRELCSAFSTMARTGEAACNVLLTGDAGVGKSELVDFFLRWGTEEELRVVRHNCQRVDQNIPLVGWEQVAVALWEIAEKEHVMLPVYVTVRLEREFHLSARVSGMKEQDAHAFRRYDPELAECLLTVIRTIARSTPLILVLENLQWMSQDSLQLLKALLRANSGKDGTVGFGLLMTCRDDYAFPMMDHLLGDPSVRRLRLQPLNADQVYQLLREELGAEEAETLTEGFYQESRGNLSLLMDLIQARHRAEGGAGDKSGSLEARVQALDGLALTAAELLAIYPRELPGNLFLELMGGDDRRLNQALTDLRREELIEELPGEGDWYYHFTYPQTREMVYERISLRRRQDLHERMGQLLIRRWSLLTGEDLRETARQFELAGDAKRAMEYGIRGLARDCAGTYIPFTREHPVMPRAPKISQVEEDLMRYQKTLVQMKNSHPELDWNYSDALLMEIRGCLAIYEGEISQGVHDLGNISGMGGRHNREQLLRVCYRLATLAVDIQSAEKAERYVTTGRRLITAEGDSLEMAAFQRLMGCCFCLREAYDKAAYYHMEAIDMLERMEQSMAVRFQLALCYSDYARVCRRTTGYAEASTYFKKAIKILKGDPHYNTLWFYVHYGRTVLALEDRERARELFETACRIGETTGEIYGRGAAEAYAALLLAQDGEYEKVEEHLSLAMRLCEKNRSVLERGILAYVCMMLRRQLDLTQNYDSRLRKLLTDSAEEYARRGIRILEGLPDVNEAKLMAKALREGISSRQSFRANELYSRNNRFMGE